MTSPDHLSCEAQPAAARPRAISLPQLIGGLMIACTLFVVAACNNDQKMIDQHQRILMEEEDPCD